MCPGIETVFLSTLAQEFNVRFSLTPINVSVAGREVTGGFELQLVGTHVAPGSSLGRGCKQCYRVLMSLLEFADGALPARTCGHSRRDREHEKLTHFGAGIGCNGQVNLVVRLLQTRRFEQANDGWAWEFLQQVRLFLLDQGCHQIELPLKAESGATSFDEPDRLRTQVSGRKDLLPASVA